MSMTLGEIRDAIMSKEMSDDGWDLRDELLALIERLADTRAEIGKLQVRCANLEAHHNNQYE